MTPKEEPDSKKKRALPRFLTLKTVCVFIIVWALGHQFWPSGFRLETGAIIVGIVASAVTFARFIPWIRDPRQIRDHLWKLLLRWARWRGR